MAQPRCPVCGCIGSRALGDYCKRHHPNARDGEEKHILDDFCEKSEISGPFFSQGDFYIIKDKFGMEDR